jgi:hypothetical protein
VPKRELEATADVLVHRRHPLHDFARSFVRLHIRVRTVPNPHLARYPFSECVSRADDELVTRIERAEAPFWRHVRETIRACRKEVGDR